MINHILLDNTVEKFIDHYGLPHSIAAYAPGRVEILGNHTDYNEGFVLSVAINMGTVFLASPSNNTTCRLVAGDLMEETSFDISHITPSKVNTWQNYVIGVLAGLREHGNINTGFNGLFLSNIPLGAGLSSSAALEMAAGLAFCSFYKLDIDKLTLAKIGQRAEHEYAGTKCGLLDQISSLYGKDDHLVMTDFRSLDIQNIPAGKDVCFLMCNTNVKHQLVDSEYNERREKCESAATFFSAKLSHPVSALRDVSWCEYTELAPAMDPVVAKRAAHVIGENERVLKGKDLLMNNDLSAFGALMYESHESSRINFENSCKELDYVVAQAKNIPGVLGARLSGGGFGGSVVILTHPRDAEMAEKVLRSGFEKKFQHPCDISVIKPSAGAKVLTS